MAITYTKLKSGEWGIRVVGEPDPAVGAQVTVSKKDGTTKTETVARVVWSGGGVTLCALESKTAKPGGGSGAREECGNCGRRVAAGTATCPHCDYNMSHDW